MPKKPHTAQAESDAAIRVRALGSIRPFSAKIDSSEIGRAHV